MLRAGPYTARVTERTLTWRERNRTLLARQLLLDRSELGVPRAVERIGGVQSQYAPPPTSAYGPVSRGSAVTI
jgi:hypothetical protein